MRRCQICDVTLGAWRRCPNFWCGRDDRGWDVAWAVAEHRGRVRDAIAALKYGGDRSQVASLAGLLARYVLAHAAVFDEVDLIVPVPSNVGRRRTFDPIGAVCAAAAPVHELWPVAGPGEVVAKAYETRPLADAPTAAARRLWAAVELRPALVVADAVAVRGRRVLAVDDVFTDGSTLREVAGLLRGAGARAVSGLVLARRPVLPPGAPIAGSARTAW